MSSLESVQELEFTRSASHLPHNLFKWQDGEDIHLATCHKDSIHVLSLSKDDLQIQSTRQICLTDGTCTVLQAKVLQIESQQILVLINENNVQFHDVRRNAIMYTFLPADTLFEESSTTRIENIAAGISQMGFFIFVGLVNGCILVVSRMEDGCIVYEDVVRGARSSPITDINADDSYVATGDTDGCIAVWQQDGQQILRKELEFDSANQYPVTTILTRNSLVVATFGSGHVRVYGVIQRRLLSEVHAHIGWINDMACFIASDREGKASSSFLIATASDDSRVRVFRVNRQFQWICHEADFSIKNQMVVGVTFLNDGSSLAAIGYDSCSAHVFRLE